MRLSLAGQRGSSLFKFGISGLWLTVFLLSTIHSNYAQAGPGTNGGAFSFAVNKFAFSEKDGNGVIVVTRDSEVGMVMIDVVAKNGTATNGIDFTFGPNTNSPATNTITFSNLQTSVSISVPIKAASVITNPHPALTATLSLANPRPALGENPAIIGTVGTRNPTAQLQIFDVKRTNEFNLDKSYYTTTEPGPGGVTTFQVNVTLPQAPTDKSSGVSVDYQVFTDRSFTTKPGSDYATEGEDYLADSGTLNFGPNDTSLPITITVTNDTLLEFNEDFHVKLSNAQGTLTMDVPPPSGGTTGST
ncbi:MAG TPA: Calx-beta domain-containing protein, partial [Verrucomicrobiae bacterium]|nr:Calx-beta domain-containing protein [Verrucomicrobiae bacterium]